MSDNEVVGEAPDLSLAPDSTADSIEQLDATLNMTLDNDTSSTLNVIDTSAAPQSDIPDSPSTSTPEEPKSQDGSERHHSRSRELVLLLALSKEARLDTNLSRKRKTASPKRRSKKLYRHVTGDNEPQEEDADKARKRKKSVSESEAAASETLRQGGKILAVDVPVFKPNKDMFCWRCHKDTVDIACETCPRSYHRRCLKQAVRNPDHWPCPECVLILKAENTQSMSPAMKDMTLEHLCSLLKFAIKRMIKCQGSAPFLDPVSEAECPEYSKYIIQPMNLTRLSQNIRENLYGSPQAFEADAKWILHNSIIFNSTQSKLTSHAKSIIKICKQEMAEIENCSSCYLNANSNKDWFVEVCPKPHLLVWAKLRGFPFWPGKVMSCKDGSVDVRFFGAHDRAWVPEEDCYLFSQKDPNFFRGRRREIEACIKELHSHVKNLEKAFGEFRYAPFKTPVDPDNELKQLQIFLPRYKPGKVLKKHRKSDANDVRMKLPEKDNEIPEEDRAKEETDLDKLGEDENMEGYGTDDETILEINTEFRKNLLQKSKSPHEDNHFRSSSNVDGSNTEALAKLIKKHAGKEKSNSVSEPSSKRTSFDSSVSRNSDAENDSPLKKINRIDFICDNMELSLGNQSVELKQIDTSNREIALSPSGKLKMVDKLMNRLSDDGVQAEKQISTEDVEKKLESSGESLTIVEDVAKEDKNEASEEVVVAATASEEKIHDPKMDEVVDVNAKSIETIETSPEDGVENESPTKVIEEICKIAVVEIENADKPIDTSVVEYGEVADVAEATTDLISDRQNVIEIIHSEETPAPITAASEEPAAPITAPLEEPKRGNKRKKSSTSDNENVETQNKIVKLVSSIDVTPLFKLTLQKVNEPRVTSSEEQPSKEIEEILNEDLEQIDLEIKSELEEDVDNQNIEAKKKYLSALNILEKGDAVTEKSNLNVIRTRSKTEEKREKSRVSENMTKVIEDVVVNYGANEIPSTTSASKSDGREISIKSFAKIASNPVEQRSSPTNQRARKSFPQPNYVKQPVKPIVAKPTATTVVSKPTTSVISAIPSPIVATVALTTTVQQPVKPTAMPPLQPIEPLRSAPNGYLILQPPQQDGSGGGMVYVPPNQMMSMTPCLTNVSLATSPSRPLVWLPPAESSITEVNLNSQNYIPQGESGAAANPETSRSVVNGHPEPSVADRVSPETSSSGGISTASAEIPIPTAAASNDSIQIVNALTATNENANDLSPLNSIVPDNVTRAVSEIIRRPPPKLKPRPPGALSQQFGEGIPSSAGPITSRINSIAHRLADYFRGMLIETLEDLGKSGDAEAAVVNLKLEVEQLKHQHQVDLKEIEKNTATVMRDVQKCVADDRERLVEEAKATWEAEAARRVEEAKSKQWCANCPKEAQMYCCWNTSYCDYPCQQKHWPAHMSKCSQNANQATTSTGVTLRPGPGANQIFLRPALNPPPKGSSVGRVIATKPMQKVFLNRSSTTSIITKPKTMRVQTSSGSLLTMKETTPGNYQLVTTTPLLRPASVVTSVNVNNSGKQQANILSLTPPTIPPKTTLRIVTHADDESLAVD